MSEEQRPLLGDQNDTSSQPLAARQRQVKNYLGLLSILCAFPLAASQIVVYDILFSTACAGLNVPPDQCSSDQHAAGHVANLFSAVSIVNGVVATLAMAYRSAVSDTKGRKHSLMMFLQYSAYGMFALLILANESLFGFLGFWRMIIPYIITAAGGTTTLMLNLSVLYITDLLPEPVVRTRYLSTLIGLMMLIQAMAPGLGGALLSSTELGNGEYLSICGVWLTLGIVVVFMYVQDSPRSEPDEESDLAEPHESLPNKSVYAQARAFVRKAFKMASFNDIQDSVRRRNAWILFVNFFLSNEFAMGFLDLIVIYAKHSFGWAASTIGANLFNLFATKTLWALLGFPVLHSVLTKRWKASETDLDYPDLIHMVLCNIVTFAGYVALSRARTSGEYTGAMIILANDAVAGPIWINALLKHVAENKRGAFMAALGLINKPVGALLPALLMKVYQATIDTNPSAVFTIVAVMTALFSFTLVYLRPTKTTGQAPQ